LSNLLLDTCGFIWLAQGGGPLSKKSLSAIDKSDFVYVSSISAWEIGFLHAKNRIQLPLDAEEWFSEICEQQNISIINVSPEIGFKANSLPWHHKDPADRLIISTALINNLTIVTQDQSFPDYNVETLG
jgi:PIN domain nuclease of toxin-antitoxin system